MTNLRYATHKENSRNASPRKDNTSGCKGVSFHKRRQKWQAQIKIDGISVHLGYYNTIEEASQARINKANQAFGDFVNACEKL